MLKLDFSFFLSIFQICWTILLHTYWSRLINSRWFLFPMCFGHVLVYIVLCLFLVQLCLNVPIYHLNKNKDVKPFSIIKKTYLSAKTLDANEQYRRNSCWNILAKLYRSWFDIATELRQIYKQKTYILYMHVKKAYRALFLTSLALRMMEWKHLLLLVLVVNKTFIPFKFNSEFFGGTSTKS